MAKDKPELFTKKKSLGQNFLTSPVVPGWLCTAANLVPGQTVLEIGPGTGVLTKELLNYGVRVVAIEADLRALDYLKTNFAAALADQQLILHHGDARVLDFAQLGLSDQQFSVVANIPYYLSGLILRQLLDSTTQPHTIALLLQKELVERIVRDPKSSLLSLSVRVFGDPKYIKTVSRGHFSPVPQVDSAILAIYNINRERLAGVSSEFFFTLTHAGLGKRRKQLLGCLSDLYERPSLIEIFTSLALPLNVRGEDLSLAQWLNLATALDQKRKSGPG